MSTTDYEVEFIDVDEREARFLVRGITPAFANGIRRAMVADVPTLSTSRSAIGSGWCPSRPRPTSSRSARA